MVGAADLLLVYAPEASALEYAEDMGVELLMQPITRDALVFLVNADNPVTSLSQEEAVGIYSGEITNWSEVGGEDRPIVAYQRVEASGSQVMMRAQVMSLKERTYVKSAQTIGESKGRILFHYIVPNGIYPIIANTTMNVAQAILTEASLSFLGLGDPNVVSWGQMIMAGKSYLINGW